jgi:hypothetical protein
MRQRQGVFDQFAASLQFPHYFGENWNAFADCVRDLDWLRAGAIVVIVLDSQDVLIDGDADEFSLLLTILSEAGNEWSLPLIRRSLRSCAAGMTVYGIGSRVDLGVVRSRVQRSMAQDGRDGLERGARA